MRRLLTIGFLLSAVWVLQSTTPTKNVAVITASNNGIKARPAGFQSVSMEVVTLEEADRRYNEKWGDKEPEPFVTDNSHCWFNDCELEWAIRLAKFELVNFFSS